jgi:cell division protein FtsI (penicillin-binding protein 3)
MNKLYPFCRKRFTIILVILSSLALLVFLRLLYLDTFKDTFLNNQGDYESVHYRQIPAIRGMLFDRNGVPLAVSAPIYDIIADPKTLLMFPDKLPLLANNSALGIPLVQLNSMLNARPKSRYLILTRDLAPSQMQSIMDMRIPGIYAQTHYQTYYPMGEPLAQVVGFTDNNNKGQDGLELALEPTLGATQGREAVLRTAKGKVLGVLQIITPAKSGKDVTLSIDSRLQYVAYEALKEQVEKVQADNGSVVILDPSNGQILAAVSYPSYNPNNPSERTGENVKDRAITDLFEPGSTIKTLTIAGALEHGKYTPTTPIDTRPGWIVVGGHRLNDEHSHGLIDVTQVLKYSSDVGITKIVFSQPREYTYNMIMSTGFGQRTGSGFPGEARGLTHPLAGMSKLEFVNMAFGYHLSVTTLQLARSYSAIANGGILYPLSFIKSDVTPVGTRIMSEKTAQEMRAMMETVVQVGGTATRASVKAFRIAGKTGTTNIAAPHGYYKDRYNAMFVGIVPANNPRLVIAIHITNPKKSYIYHQGGMTSAPVFATIANSAVRILGIPTSGTSS